MKLSLKHSLSRLGIFQELDLIRRIPDCVRWLSEGAIGPAPPPIKRAILRSYLRRYKLGAFVETGTFRGDTLAAIAQDRRVMCFSIELSHDLHEAATRRFSRYSNVHLRQGDSAIVLPDIVRQIQQPALFWLDGHYSGGGTAKGAADTPISAELETVLNSDIKGHVVLVDDARCFDGTHDYPHLDELLRAARTRGSVGTCVSADIARITPLH